MYSAVLKKIADRHQVSVDEIRKEMEASIEEGYRAQTVAWVSLFGSKKPTIEEFLDVMVRKLKKTHQR